MLFWLMAQHKSLFVMLVPEGSHMICCLHVGEDFNIIQQEIAILADCKHANIVGYSGSYLRYVECLQCDCVVSKLIACRLSVLTQIIHFNCELGCHKPTLAVPQRAFENLVKFSLQPVCNL